MLLSVRRIYLYCRKYFFGGRGVSGSENGGKMGQVLYLE